MQSPLLIILFLFIPFFSAGKYIDVIAELKSGEKLELSVKGYSKGLFSPYSRFYTSTKERINLEDIDSFKTIDSKVSYEVLEIKVGEDASYVIATLVMANLYRAIVRYRPCTCNENYRNVKAFVHLVNGQRNVILKRVFSDKVLKLEGRYTGLSPELENQLKELNYSFSAIPSLLSEGRN